MAQWFLRQQEKESGPFTSAQLRAMAAHGQIAPDDHVRRDDQTKWVKASAVKGLIGEAAAPTTPAQAQQVAQPEKGQPSRSRSPMMLLGLAAGAGLALFMVCCGILGVIGSAQRRTSISDTSPTNSVAVANVDGEQQPFKVPAATFDALPVGCTLEVRKGLRRTLYPGSEGSEQADYWIEERGYISADKRFVPHGETKVWFSKDKNQLRQQFTMLHGKAHGSARHWHPNGQMSDDQFFVENQPHGKEQQWYANGQLRLKAQYDAGILTHRSIHDSEGRVVSVMERRQDGTYLKEDSERLNGTCVFKQRSVVRYSTKNNKESYEAIETLSSTLAIDGKEGNVSSQYVSGFRSGLAMAEELGNKMRREKSERLKTEIAKPLQGNYRHYSQLAAEQRELVTRVQKKTGASDADTHGAVDRLQGIADGIKYGGESFGISFR